MNKETGLIEEGKLNEVVIVETRRKDGSLRIQQDFKYCPTMAEQHSARETDINYLIKKYQPDELGAYLAARANYKQEIIGHDFSIEPSLQDASNVTYHLKKLFNNLPEKIKNNFKNHVEFLKFIDNPANQEKMIELGLMTKTEINQHTSPNPTQNQNDDPNDESQTLTAPTETPLSTTKHKTKK